MGKDVTVTPEACAGAVQGTQPDLDAFDDVAGVTATAGSTATVEILLRGGPTDGAVAQLAEAVERCPEARISSPQLGEMTIRFEELPVPDLGDGAAAVRYTTALTMPDGTETTVPALVGAVEDGDRLVVLLSVADPAGVGVPPDPAAPTDPAAGGAARDPAAFTALLEEAYETQADALG
jgi:hypothetical protein